MKNQELDQRPKIIEKLKEKVGNLLKNINIQYDLPLHVI